MPQRRSGIRSMLVYGGTVTLHGLILYLAFNVDKVLIGRFWARRRWDLRPGLPTHQFAKRESRHDDLVGDVLGLVTCPE